MQITWERFDPERLGYEALSGWLTEFYQMPPWNEYLKCFNCGGRDDFGPAGAYGHPEVEEKGMARCPHCGGSLELFWSPPRVEEYFRQLREKGPLLGSTVVVGGEPAAWVWGYEVTPATPAPWGMQRQGLGIYIDVLAVLPKHRNGLVLWYLFLTILRQMKSGGYQYLVSRTHRQADIVSTLFQRLKFRELARCPQDQQRSYWMWEPNEPRNDAPGLLEEPSSIQ